MTTENIIKPHAESAIREEAQQSENKVRVSVDALVESLKNVADDIGQISELTSEEKLLIAEFFSSLLKLMRPLTPAVPVSTAVLPMGDDLIVQAYIDPTGHLAIVYEDAHFELKDLSEEKNRDLMIAVAKDALPKFRRLTTEEKRKIEERIKFLSVVTKEIQKSAEAFSLLSSTDK